MRGPRADAVGSAGGAGPHRPGAAGAGVDGAGTYRAVCVALTVAVCTGMLLLAAGLVPLALTRDVAPAVPWQPVAPAAADQDSSPTR